MFQGSPIHIAFLIIAVILFLISLWPLVTPNTESPSWSNPAVKLGLAFFAGSFLVG